MNTIKNMWVKFKQHWTLIKSKQTFLLVITGWAGFASAACPVTHRPTLLAALVCMFLVISGCTMYNMIYDRDIDAKMKRTVKRPLPSGELSVREVFIVATIITVVGLVGAYRLSPLFSLILATGLFIDAVVYTIWLKRHTAYSIIFGGVSGGMPILAGRALGLGSVDIIGALLALAILLWIPTHIMTFSIKYADDYNRAGVPTFPSEYGVDITRKLIALSTVLASIAMVLAAHLIGIRGYYGLAMIVFSVALISLATVYIKRPSPKLDMRLFKVASLYMLGAMLLIGLGVA